SKEPHPPEWTGYQLLALIFGTLLSSQGTDASFVLTLSNIGWGFPPGFRSCDSDSIRVFLARFPGPSLSRFPFRRLRLYQCFSFSPTTRRCAGMARRKGVEIEIVTA
ncbi:hypothetical protein, partial [Streptomyces sp. NPDC029721]|uniref:hypothetical protein n=1 Tax=Streptomyces sp. NPDC029721 TaxID=3157090 RepID=UPI0033D677AE